jgi:NAD(P)-dependent dehydrogenase (short-subunit alcohol dehydrogenase family)
MSTASGLVAGKVALITGAASGIGRAAAIAFAREGARVLVADIDETEGVETARAAQATGGEAEFCRVDVCVESDVEAMVGRCVERFGRLDCAFNNAGVAGPADPLHMIDFEQWSRTLAVNLSGVFLCMKHELLVMKAQGAGAIVNTASGAGLIATPGMAAYCASKHAILGITKTAAVENAKAGVRVNAVCPGATDTQMLRGSMELSANLEKMILANMPGGRLGKAEEIAEAALWLCSDRASFVSGESMLVDGASVAR